MAGWKRLASATADGSSSTLSVSFTANDVIRLQVYGQNTSGAGNFQIRFNNDTTANRHKTRRVYDGAGTSSNRYDDYSSTKFISYSPTSALQSYMIIDVHNIDNEEHLVMGNSVESGATGAGSTGVPHTVNWMGKYTEKTPQVTSVQLITNSNNLNDKSYINVLTTADNVVTDEKDSLTNVPANSRFEDYTSRKIYRASVVEPKFLYKFDESSGDVINHGSVGTSANLTVTGLTRDVSSPSGIGNGMSGAGIGGGDYATTTEVNAYKFLHDGSSWSITYWSQMTELPTSSTTETFIFGNVWTDDQGTGIMVRTGYVSASSGARLQVVAAANNNDIPLNVTADNLFIPDTTDWHFYALTFDGTTLTMQRDNATSGVGYKTGDKSANAFNTGNPTRKPTWFNRDSSQSDKAYGGKLAQFTIWDRVLTANEKTALYNSDNGTTTLPSPLEWKERNTA